jgi:heat shock protein HtpX
MESSRSLRTRALMALLLMVGFYGFALAIAVGLLWIPYAEYTYLDRVDGRIALVCIIGAGTIVWALVPRIDKFEAPGPRLTPANAPYLFSMIHDVAKATSQPRPEEVYLLGDVNAFVSHRGGVMGIGSRRVMGVGLPLLKALSPAELRSVIAHEFGHFVSGDVALGPWIYKTRGAIFRALEGVSGNWILEKLFNLYGTMFMRMTMQVSREQEFVADATAARVAGVAPAVSALKKVEMIAAAYSGYIDNDIMPVVRAGYLPPLNEGFGRYMSDPDMSKALHEFATKSYLGGETGEYDSHPPMNERVAALERIKQKPSENPRDATAMMLKEPERHARALIEHMWGREEIVKLKPIAWEEVGAKVYAGQWADVTKEHAKLLGTLTADQVPADRRWFLKMGAELAAMHERTDVSPEGQIGYAGYVVTCAVGTALLNAGWTLETGPGRPILFRRGEERFDPRQSINKLAEGVVSAESEWRERCESLGIAGTQLAPPASSSAAAASSAPAVSSQRAS